MQKDQQVPKLEVESEESGASGAETLPVALRNDEISQADFEELCRLAELASHKKRLRRIPVADPANAAK
jgi:hypothetical protein